MKSYKEIAEFMGVELGREFWLYGRPFVLSEDKGLYDKQYDVYYSKFPKIISSITFSNSIVLKERPPLTYKEFAESFYIIVDSLSDKPLTKLTFKLLATVLKISLEDLKEDILSAQIAEDSEAFLEKLYMEFIERVYSEK